MTPAPGSYDRDRIVEFLDSYVDNCSYYSVVTDNPQLVTRLERLGAEKGLTVKVRIADPAGTVERWLKQL